MTLKHVIEALVFASPKPLTTAELLAALRGAGEETEDQLALDFAKVPEDIVLGALAELQREYVEGGRAFRLAEQVKGWAFVTDPATALWVRQLYPEAKPTRLSGPALETLAIIAYRQPVTRADIEAVRGVAVDGVMQVLLDRGLVKIAGRAELPGRPLLYETTEYFLQHFGLREVGELPNCDELRRIDLPKAPSPEAGKSEIRNPKSEIPESPTGDAEPAESALLSPEPADAAAGEAVEAGKSEI